MGKCRESVWWLRPKSIYKKKEFAAQRPNWQRPMMGCLDTVAIPVYLMLVVWWRAVGEDGGGMEKREPGRRR